MMGFAFPKEKKVYLALLGAVLYLVLVFFLAAPVSFPTGTFVTVADGTGLYKLSLDLKENRVVRSTFLFRASAIVLGGERDMKAGEYYLSTSQNAFVIAWRIFHGEYDIESVKVTIPEGFTTKKISNLFDERFTLFDHRAFESTAPVGYLFPDTYFVPVTATASSTIKLLRDNFAVQVAPLLPRIESFGKSLEEVIIMASILEGEVTLEEDRRIVSGILWKRLKIGMALQVDSEPETYDSPGLPPSPISNPGLESIEAAITPVTTPFLYFLSGSDGETHYAKTFEEHKVNKQKYLK